MSTMVSIYPKAPTDANFITSFFDYDWILPAYIGYSIYDCGTMYFQGDNHWSMWVHHLVGIYGGLGNIAIRKLSVLSTFAMMTEVTAMTVNILWYAETLNSTRPQPDPYRRSSITTTMGDTDTPDDTPTVTPSPSMEFNKSSAAAVTADAAATGKHPNRPNSSSNKKKSTKPPPTLTLVTLQTLRTLSFLVFRVTAVPFSFYLVVSRGGAAAAASTTSSSSSLPGFYLSGAVELVGTVWNGCSTCSRDLLDWDFDRAIGFSALIVQMLFGLLNVVWTAVAIKVLRREIRGYMKVQKGDSSGGKHKNE